MLLVSPPVLLVTPRGCCGCSLGSSRRWRISLAACKAPRRPCQLEGCARAPRGAVRCFCTGYKIPCSWDLPLPETSEVAQRFAACWLLPAWVLMCAHTRCMQAEHCQTQWGRASPCLSSNTQGWFSPCPKFSWLRVINSWGGDVPASHDSCERLSRGCQQAVAESCGLCLNKAISVKPEVGDQRLTERWHRSCLAFAGA